MNDDSISRKQAIEAVQNRPFTLSKEKVLLINDLEKLPPMQPKRGKWIQISKSPDSVKGYWATCSACDRRIFGGGKFCPLCGADMRKEAT